MSSNSLWENRRLRQIILLVAGFMAAIWIVVVVLFYNFTVTKHEQSTLLRLAGIANSLALQIDGDIHEKIFKTYAAKDAIIESDQDSLYLSIHQLLRKNYTANMLKSPIYTIRMNDSGQFYEFGVTSDTSPYYRHPYDSFHPTLNSQYETGGMIPEYNDEFGMWLTAFAPVKNENGKTVAVVMVDEKLDIFLTSVRDELIKMFLLSLGIFVLLMLWLLWQLRKILTREQRDKNMIEEAHQKIIKINEALSAANQKLYNLDSFRKEMISNISHDLRTPLASIIGFLDLVRKKNKDLSEEDKNTYIETAYTESNRLNRMVSDLFELSKLESGQITIQKEPFNLYELVSDIVQKYQLKIKARHVDLHYDITENLGLAYGDIKYIDRVFQNLLDNAVRYVYEGGYLKISILDGGQVFKIKICNSGDIIPPKDLEFIFDRYYTKEKTDNTRTGLGLAIAKSICTLHGCTIKAESNEFVNSFWFTVPKDVRNI